MSDTLRITLAQVRFVGWDGEALVAAAREVLSGIAPGSTDLVVFPELCPGIVEPMADEARRLGAWIVANGVRRHEDGGFVNRSLVYGPDGTVAGEYVKTYLHESEIGQHFVPGGAPDIIVVNGHRVGVMICSDVGLGVESLLALNRLGAEMVLVPAAAFVDSLAYWRWHLVVKSLDTGLPICMVNYGGVGPEPNAMGGGRSMVVAPLPAGHEGQSLDEFLGSGAHRPEDHVLTELGGEATLATVAIDLDAYRRMRTELAKHRRRGLDVLADLPRGE